MKNPTVNRPAAMIAAVVSIAVAALGFVPAANAGIVTTADSLQTSERQERLASVRSAIDRADVAERLAAFGVAPEMVDARLDGLTDSELAELRVAIVDANAGGDALGIIGAVFLVLLILELVGVTNVFNAI